MDDDKLRLLDENKIFKPTFFSATDAWDFLRDTETYKAAGIWGSVIRTCMGPEDPCWELNKDKILELNKFFLED